MEQKKSEFLGFTDEGYPIVSHTNSCLHWAQNSPSGLCPIRECWYCKFADFRKSTSVDLSASICRHPKNRLCASQAPEKN
ncbi:MAG: hypothetical protein RR731_07585, partial [Oscillospiraceae bacterium]